MPDYSKERDAIAKDTATERMEDAVLHGKELSDMVHRMKGELAANTAFTLEAASDIKAMKTEIAKVDFGKLSDMVDAIETMKGGVKVLGWLERPAKWIAAIGAAIAVFYTAWHHK